jgi:hypothetical protein
MQVHKPSHKTWLTEDGQVNMRSGVSYASTLRPAITHLARTKGMHRLTYGALTLAADREKGRGCRF